MGLHGIWIGSHAHRHGICVDGWVCGIHPRHPVGWWWAGESASSSPSRTPAGPRSRPLKVAVAAHDGRLGFFRQRSCSTARSHSSTHEPAARRCYLQRYQNAQRGGVNDKMFCLLDAVLCLKLSTPRLALERAAQPPRRAACAPLPARCIQQCLRSPPPLADARCTAPPAPWARLRCGAPVPPQRHTGTRDAPRCLHDDDEPPAQAAVALWLPGAYHRPPLLQRGVHVDQRRNVLRHGYIPAIMRCRHSRTVAASGALGGTR